MAHKKKKSTVQRMLDQGNQGKDRAPEPYRPGLPGAPVEAMREGGVGDPPANPYRPGLPGQPVPV